MKCKWITGLNFREDEYFSSVYRGLLLPGCEGSIEVVAHVVVAGGGLLELSCYKKLFPRVKGEVTN